MNGWRHATTGVAAGLVTSVAAANLGVPVPLWIGAAVAGSILPDADHPNASIAHMWGFVSQITVEVLSPVLGGHRGLTHRPLLFSAAMAAILAAASFFPPADVVAWTFLCAVFLTAAFRAVGEKMNPVLNFVVALVAGAALASAFPPYLAAGPLAVGICAHIAGDELPEKSTAADIAVAVSYVIIVAGTLWYLRPFI